MPFLIAKIFGMEGCHPIFYDVSTQYLHSKHTNPNTETVKFEKNSVNL